MDNDTQNSHQDSEEQTTNQKQIESKPTEVEEPQIESSIQETPNIENIPLESSLDQRETQTEIEVQQAPAQLQQLELKEVLVQPREITEQDIQMPQSETEQHQAQVEPQETNPNNIEELKPETEPQQEPVMQQTDLEFQKEPVEALEVNQKPTTPQNDKSDIESLPKSEDLEEKTPVKAPEPINTPPTISTNNKKSKTSIKQQDIVKEKPIASIQSLEKDQSQITAQLNPKPQSIQNTNATSTVNKKDSKKTVSISHEELLKWSETTQKLKAEIAQKNEILKKQDEELKKRQKAFDYEKEGYIDRNKNLQNLLDSAKDKYEKSRKKAINLEFQNEELNKEIKKIEEEMGFYKLEVKEKFNLELKVAALDEEIQALRKLRDKFNSENLAIINTELKASNENYKKQNEHLNATIEKLGNDSKKYIKLIDERDNKIKDLQANILKLEAKNRELGNVKDTLEEQLNESNVKSIELESTIEILKNKSRKDTKALKKEINISKDENKNLLERNDKLKLELDKLIQNLRRTPKSAVEYQNNTDASESKQEKIILETLVFKNRELENELKGYRRENGKIKLFTESLTEKLDLKQAALEEAVNFIYSDQYIKTADISKKDFLEKDLKRIENAKANKSLEEMRDLLEKLLTDNIKLKRSIEKVN